MRLFETLQHALREGYNNVDVVHLAVESLNGCGLMSGRQRDGIQSPDPHLKTAIIGTIFGTTITCRSLPASQTENDPVLTKYETPFSTVGSGTPAALTDGPASLGVKTRLLTSRRSVLQRYPSLVALRRGSLCQFQNDDIPVRTLCRRLTLPSAFNIDSLLMCSVNQFN